MKQMRYNKKNIKKINIDNIAREDIKEHKPNWQHMPDLWYRILIIRRSWPGKTNALLNLISHLPIINKLIKLHAKDPMEVKYSLLINPVSAWVVCTLLHAQWEGRVGKCPTDLNFVLNIQWSWSFLWMITTIIEIKSQNFVVVSDSIFCWFLMSTKFDALHAN